MEAKLGPRPETLAQYIQVNRDRCNACIDVVENDLAIDGMDVALRMHFVKFDSNGLPKVKDLAECLVDHIVYYSGTARRLKEPWTSDQASRVFRQARDLFTKKPQSGEAGEVLLYVLMEAVLGAPQVVAKIVLKTNPKMEIHGSDGIHMKWDAANGVLDIYFGEAKLYQNVAQAVKEALDSIERFHEDDILSHEVQLVTSNFKLADSELREVVEAYLDRQNPIAPDCRIRHACLIGYDWDEYAKLAGIGRDRVVDEFRTRYAADGPRLRDLLSRYFAQFTRKHLSFDVFFVPFRSVQELRDEFGKALCGA